MTSPSLHICVLDAGTITLPASAWDPLRALGTLTLHEHTPHDDEALIRERCSGAQIVLTNKVPLGRETLQANSSLQMIGILATGYNIVDTQTAREKGLPVCNVPSYSTASVAQHTLALILELTNRAGLHSAAIQAGKWSRSRFFSFQERPVIALANRTVGLIGFGEIARAVGQLVTAFGARVLAYRRHPGDTPDWPGFRWAKSTEDVLREADIVSLHCPLTPETEGLINATSLGWMKPGAFLINTARGPLIEEEALMESLRNGHLGGAALDVVSREPLPIDSPLLTDEPNLIMTPHIAWATAEAQQKLLEQTVQNIRAFQANQPIHVVN